MWGSGGAARACVIGLGLESVGSGEEKGSRGQAPPCGACRTLRCPLTELCVHVHCFGTAWMCFWALYGQA